MIPRLIVVLVAMAIGLTAGWIWAGRTYTHCRIEAVVGSDLSPRMVTTVCD